MIRPLAHDTSSLPKFLVPETGTSTLLVCHAFWYQSLVYTTWTQVSDDQFLVPETRAENLGRVPSTLASEHFILKFVTEFFAGENCRFIEYNGSPHQC